MRNPGPRKNCRHFLLEGLIHYGRQRHVLEIKCWTRAPRIKYKNTFPLSQRLELWLYHQCDDKRPFRQINPRWPPSTSWKINVWNGAHTVRYKYTFSTKTTMTSSILIYILQLNITLTLLSRWLPYVGVKWITKTKLPPTPLEDKSWSKVVHVDTFFS